MRIGSLTILLAIFSTAICLAQGGGTAESVLAGIKAEKDRCNLGETVKATYAIENRGNQPVIFHFTSGKLFDVWAKSGSEEVWRWSAGRMFTQALTSFTLAPGERKNFDVEWNQKNRKGEQVGPGAYELWGELTTSDPKPKPVSRKIALGSGPAVVTTTVGGAISLVGSQPGKTVSVDATYQGMRADSSSPSCKPGPPVTRSDWAIQDPTGCIFVTGQTTLDPVADIGKHVRVLGAARQTAKGQPYIELQSLTVVK